MAARVYNAAEFKQDLYDRITGDGEVILLLSNTAYGDIPHSIWHYVASSTATDDFANGIVQPTLQTGSGRWIRLYKWATVATTGDYNDLLNKPSASKKVETFAGTTNASGNYTVTFGAAYAATPNIQANIIGGSNTNLIKITAVSTTGFTVNVVNRTDVVGLLPAYANVNGASVQALITEA